MLLVVAAGAAVVTAGCTPTVTHGEHWPDDGTSIEGLQLPTADRCSQQCCENPKCGHWVFTTYESKGAGNCAVGVPCCWLKPGPAVFPTAPNPNMTIGVLDAAPNATGNVTVTIDPHNPIARPMDPRYVSVGVEMWEWLFDPDALETTVLREVASSLSPMVVRVGGISADQTHFTPDPFPSGLPWPPVAGSTNTNLLNITTFDRLIAFCRGTGNSLIFNLNEMWGRSMAPTPTIAPLNLTGVEALLRHAAVTGAIAPDGPLFGVELGNELTPRLLDVVTQAADYRALRDLLDRIFPAGGGPKLYGPATSNPGNMTQFLTLSAPARLDGFSFHSYPLSGSHALETELLSPSVLTQGIPGGFAPYLNEWRASNISIPAFMSETNSDASTSANAGQDRFVNGFWYLSSLGSAAAAGMPLHVRWKLWNPRVAYRPFALNQTFGFVDKALKHAVPELWVAILHKRLIGGAVPVAAKPDGYGVVAWAHQRVDTTVLMIANPQPSPINVSIQLTDVDVQQNRSANMCQHVYILSPGPGGVNSTGACLNQPHCTSPLALGPSGEPPTLPPHIVPVGDAVQMPPTSYGFVVIGTDC